MGPCSPQGSSSSNRAVYGSPLGRVLLRDRTLICHFSDLRGAKKINSQRGDPEQEALSCSQGSRTLQPDDPRSPARGGHSSALLPSLSLGNRTLLLHFPGLSHLKQGHQLPVTDVAEAKCSGMARLPGARCPWSTWLLPATSPATVRETHLLGSSLLGAEEHPTCVGPPSATPALPGHAGTPCV